MCMLRDEIVKTQFVVSSVAYVFVAVHILEKTTKNNACLFS